MDPLWVISIMGFGMLLVGLILMLLDRPRKDDDQAKPISD